MAHLHFCPFDQGHGSVRKENGLRTGRQERHAAKLWRYISKMNYYICILAIILMLFPRISFCATEWSDHACLGIPKKKPFGCGKIMVAPVLLTMNNSLMIDFIRQNSLVKIEKKNGKCKPSGVKNDGPVESCNEYGINLAIRNEFAEKINVEAKITECKELAREIGNEANSQICTVWHHEWAKHSTANLVGASLDANWRDYTEELYGVSVILDEGWKEAKLNRMIGIQYYFLNSPDIIYAFDIPLSFSMEIGH